MTHSVLTSQQTLCLITKCQLTWPPRRRRKVVGTSPPGCQCRLSVAAWTATYQTSWRQAAMVLRPTYKSTMSTGLWSYFDFNVLITTWGSVIRVLMRGMATLPQGNQELLVVRDKVGRPPGELEVSKSMECDIFPSVLWHLVRRQEGHPACKKWMLVCWWWFDWSFAGLIAPVVQLLPPPPSSFASIDTG